MHETEPCNDVTPPCPDCGEVSIPCECGKPIETVAQLQRALEAAGVTEVSAVFALNEWQVTLDAPGPRLAIADGSALAEAVRAALDDWWSQEAGHDD